MSKVLALMACLAAALGLAAAARTPPLPSWVRMAPLKGRALKEYKSNVALVKRAGGTRYDVVMYGDSITAFHAKSPEVWNDSFRSVRAAPMGVGGSTVEELMWRLAKGGETFEKDPRVIIVLCGINNLKWSRSSPSPVAKMDFLLAWMSARSPRSALILLNLMPNKAVDVRPTNADYRGLASKYGATFSSCGSDIDARDRKLMPDGTHLSAEGHRRVLACLKPTVLARLAIK